MNVEHFGKSLVNMPKISIKAAGSRTLEYEGADVVSDCVGAVKGVLASPDKIMLTGLSFSSTTIRLKVQYSSSVFV